GTILPVGSENIGKDVSGTVKKIYVQNGDKVKKGDLLAELVNDSLSLQVANARLDLEKARLNLADSSTQLSYDNITAPFSGRIVSLEINTGDEVSKGAVLATLQDDSQLVFDMPVDSAAAKKVSVNQKVEVFLPDQGETVEGRVIVKNSQPVSGYNGENRVYLKIAVAATGNLSSGTKAFGTLTIDGKQVDALSVSTLAWKDQTQLKATLAGKVTGLYAREGQAVRKGQRLFALNSDTAQNQHKTLQVAYEQAQLNLTDLENQLSDLAVKAPIDGIVSGMDVKEGDEIKSSGANSGASSSDSTTTASNGSLGKIINTGQMEVSFPVDEVDIAKVKVGQTANVTVDALPDETFKGKVTDIAEEGVVTNNVSSFEVTILIDNPKSLLKSGMTANVTIVVAQKDNVVLIPIEALQERGGRKFVLTPPSEGSAQGRNMKPVTVGLTNESFAEITEGLQEGDKVLLPGQQANAARTNPMMPGFGGGNRPGGSGGNRSGGGFGGMR
ncbi:MAG: efflux RND transporter periplasmic adaptor subunit, partial [Bacillota bacterium]